MKEGLIRKTVPKPSILGIGEPICQISAQNVKKWPRYRCDRRTNERTNEQEPGAGIYE